MLKVLASLTQVPASDPTAEGTQGWSRIVHGRTTTGPAQPADSVTLRTREVAFEPRSSHVRVDAELELLAAMRDAGVRQVALRATGLSPRSLAAIASMIEHARQIEGLTPVADGDTPPQ